MGPALVFFVCGALSITAAWLIYRRRSSGLAVFCVSWMLNVVASVYARLSTHSDPVWHVVCYAAAVACLALILINSVRRAISSASHPSGTP
jgi:NADH:ubiquinone oxidoreductase subunit 6 (subunit J)